MFSQRPLRAHDWEASTFHPHQRDTSEETVEAPAEEVGKTSELRTIASGIIVKFEDGDGVELHIERDSESFCVSHELSNRF